MKAILKTYRQSPRKVRLLADLIRGKKIGDARNALMFADKKSAPIVLKLLDSAISNAKNNGNTSDADLFVKSVTVDKGVTMKRIMPRARGSAFPINKRTSHIAIELGVKEVSGEAKSNKKVVKAKAKKVK